MTENVAPFAVLCRYAAFLGVDCEAHPEIVPILAANVNAELPPGWRVVFGEEGNALFYNDATGECSCEHPNDHSVRQACLDAIEASKLPTKRPPVKVAKMVDAAVSPSDEHPSPPASTTRRALLQLQNRVDELEREKERVIAELKAAKAQTANVPSQFVCPITGDVMQDPVVTSDGFSYERKAIEKWLRHHDTSPMTNEKLPFKQLVPNMALRSQILEYTEHLQVHVGSNP